MTDPLMFFPPTQSAALTRLKGFLPHAGTTYAQRRNFDHGVAGHVGVSTLSPYVRARALDEVSITRAVLAHHSATQAEKFIAEVFWRTYWKGWMELRPGVWDSYQSDLGALHNQVQTQSGLRRQWEDACLGQTGNAPFDHWSRELVQTGYLHNHARMWFASIWVFTLNLPWQLGADFFLRHLLDGDAAVNTLSWRWVAGIQTRGKTYLARASNIATFTGGRFEGTKGLATQATAIDAPAHPAPRLLPDVDVVDLKAPYGVLVHSEDVNPLHFDAPQPVAWAYATGDAAQSPWQMAPSVDEFRFRLAQDITPPLGATPLTTAEAILEWAQSANLAQIVTPYAPVGPMQQMFEVYQSLPGAIPLSQQRRALDTKAWPLATKGFFPFKAHIPSLIEEFC